MKSSASIKGHPVHPMLVCFPIAFFIGTLVFDVLGFLWKPQFSQTAIQLQIAGLAAAVLAAIPGLIDYNKTVPPNSTAKKRAMKHGLTNSAVLVVFGAALWYRSAAGSPSPYVVIALELAGVIMMGFAGWMGATLVHRNQIGVDLRYAGAGKWREDVVKVTNGQFMVDDIDSLKLNQMRLIHADGKRIVIGRSESGLVAFDDRCTHRGAALAGGAMICGTVQCPWHGSQFSTSSGELLIGPGKENIAVYPSIQENGKLIVRLTNDQGAHKNA